MRWIKPFRQATSKNELAVTVEELESPVRCRFPRCPLPALNLCAFVPDGRASPPYQIELCGDHTKRLLKVEGMAAFLYRVGQAAQDPVGRVVGMSAQSSMRKLDRAEYLDLAVKELSTTTSFYGAYEGPSCFHPDWFFTIQKDAVIQPGRPSPGSAEMDAALGSLMTRETAGERWLICRNSDKYRAKVDAITDDPKLQKVLREETVEAIEAFFADRPASASVASFDIGHVRIPYIFESCVLTARRLTALEPVSEALVSWDRLAVDFERETFRQLFQATVRGWEEERNLLVSFVEEALS